MTAQGIWSCTHQAESTHYDRLRFECDWARRQYLAAVDVKASAETRAHWLMMQIGLHGGMWNLTECPSQKELHRDKMGHLADALSISEIST